jgi:hypothetical protein
VEFDPPHAATRQPDRIPTHPNRRTRRAFIVNLPRSPLAAVTRGKRDPDVRP